MSARFAGKAALVTGAASGIGEATVRRLASEGAAVAVADINEDGGRAVADSLDGHAQFVPLDAASEGNWAAAMAAVNARFGRLDLLVNCAGAGGLASIEDETLEHWDLVLSTNLTGAFLGCRAAIAEMRKVGGGAIVNISSAAGTRALADQPAYCAAKAGMLQLTRSIALHCARAGHAIRCNAIQPGITDTPRLRVRDDEFGGHKAMLQAVVDRYQPMGRALSADEIAASVAFLLSDEAAMITGVALPVDGGFVL